MESSEPESLRRSTAATAKRQELFLLGNESIHWAFEDIIPFAGNL